MKNSKSKKILHMILCLTLLASAHISVSASELTEEQLSTLYEYEIFQGNEFGELNLDKDITRAEFCKVISSSLGYSKDILAETQETDIFVDVKNSHWAYLYINNAQKLSLMDGDENRFFSPEANMSMNEVIKIIVDSLGYKDKAEMSGGYPEGYVLIADDLGLTKNIAYSSEKLAVRKDIAKMIYTALDIPLMQMVGFGAEVEYKVMDGTEDTPLVTWRTKLMK